MFVCMKVLFILVLISFLGKIRKKIFMYEIYLLVKYIYIYIDLLVAEIEKLTVQLAIDKEWRFQIADFIFPFIK